MATYPDRFLGIPGGSHRFDEPLVGGVTYAIGVFGASSGGTLPDPAVNVFDAQGNFLISETDTWLMGEDVLLQWTPPSTGTYTFQVLDEIGGTGSYTFSVEIAGPSPFLDPRDFGTFGL